MENSGSVFQVQFSDTDLRNIYVFLERVELKGKEVPAYAEIQRAIANAVKLSGSPKKLETMKPVKEDKISVDETE